MQLNSVHFVTVLHSMNLTLRLLFAHVFPANSETTYRWTAEVSTGVTLPESNDNHASYFAFNANLRVRTDATNKVVFKIEDMSHSAYNGPVEKNKSPKDGHNFVEKCKECGTTFAAIYEKGQITSIELNESDELYIRNTKRAIMSQFQLDIGNIKLSQAFTSVERGVSGLCQLKQSVQPHQDQDYVSLRKFFDNNECSEKPEKNDDLGFHQCDQRPWNPAFHTTERNYKLSTDGKLFVKTVKSRSAISTQPEGLDTETYFHITKQNLEIISTEPVHDDVWAPGKTISTSLVFEFPTENLETGEDIDLSFGKIVYEPEITVNKTMRIFKQLAERLKFKRSDTLSVKQLHEFSPKQEIAAWYLRSMNIDTLRTLAEAIVKTEDKATRRVALDMFPRIGTLAAVRVIMQDFRGKVEDLEFVNMLMEMPFHLRHRSLELLQVCKEMMKFGTDPELLAFGAIVGEVCENTNACPNISTIVKLTYDEIQAQEDYNTKLMLIQFLGNIHLETVAEHLEPLIRDKVNYTHNLRFAAVWAAHHTQIKHPEKAYEFYWPILEDKTEHHDMRQAALTVLLYSSPTTERFLNLLWYINSNKDPDIYNMFYTTVKSLLDTNHPCFQQLSLSAEEIFRLMPKREVPSFASFNMIADYKDPGSGNGFKFQTVMISDVKTGFPNILYVDVEPLYNNLRGNSISLHLRVDGSAIRETINVRRWIPNNETGEFPILQVLQSLGVTARENPPTNIEIIVMRNGRTVACECIKHFQIDKLFDLLKWRIFGSWIEDFDVPSHSSPVTFRFNGINGETQDRNSIYETVVANDVGIPVTYYLKEPGVLTLEGSVKILDGPLNSSLETSLTLRYLGDKNQGIYSLNPVMGLWHGVSRSRINDVTIILENMLKSIADLDSLTLSTEWKNDTVPLFVVNHVETMTYLEGDETNETPALVAVCPKCEVTHTVHINEPHAEFKTRHVPQFESQYVMFDCETENYKQVKDKERFFNAFTSTEKKNARSSMWLKPLLGLVAMSDVRDRTPATGSCAEAYRVRATGKASKLEVVFRPKLSEKTLEINLKDPEGNSVKSFIGTYDLKDTFTNLTEFKTFTLQLRPKVDYKPFNITCIRADFNVGRDGDFNLLHEPLAVSEKLRYEYNVGLSHEGECPDHNNTEILITGTSSWNKMENKNYAQCELDRGENSVYPATESCVNTAKQFWHTRKVSIDVNLNELNKSEESFVATIHRMLPETVPERIPNEFRVDMEYNDGKVAVWLTGAENPGKWHDLEQPFSYTNFFDNINSYRNLLIKLETCYIAGNYVHTYDGTSIKYNAQQKWTLLTADCVALPTFAVFTRKIEGSDMLALQFHVLEDVVEVTPTESTFDVTINGKPYESFNETTLPDFLWLTLRENEIFMTGVSINTVHIYYSRKYLTITTYSDFSGWTCGLCGDFNLWPETSSNFPGPDGKPVNLEDVTSVYTLP